MLFSLLGLGLFLFVRTGLGVDGVEVYLVDDAQVAYLCGNECRGGLGLCGLRLCRFADSFGNLFALDGCHRLGGILCNSLGHLRLVGSDGSFDGLGSDLVVCR